MVQQNLVIWMFQKSPRKVFCTLKLVRLTMQAPRFGEISHMTTSLTFGPWVVSCTNLWLWNPHFVRRICRVYTRKCSEESTPRCRTYSVMNLPTQLRWWYKWLLRWGQIATRYWLFRLSRRRSKNSFRMLLRFSSRKWICWVLSEFQRTFFIWQIDFQSQCTIPTHARGEKKKNFFAEGHTKALSLSLKCSQISQVPTEARKGDNTTTSLNLDQSRWLLEVQDQTMLHRSPRKSKQRVSERSIIKISWRKSTRKERLLQQKRMKILQWGRERAQEKMRDLDYSRKKEGLRQSPKHWDKVLIAR